MSEPKKSRSAPERILRAGAPGLFSEGRSPIDPLDLSIILLNAIDRGVATESRLADYCRGGDGPPCQLPKHFRNVLRRLVRDGFITEASVQNDGVGSGVEKRFELTPFGRSSISLE